MAYSLVHRVVNGEFERLPREDDLVAEYGVAKGTAREARRALEDWGFVEVAHGRSGAAIRPASHWNLFEPTILRAIVDSPEREAVLAEALECRALLEPQVAQLAARRAGEADVAALEQAIARMREAAKHPAASFAATEGRGAAERAFQDALLAASGNRFLAHALAPLADATTEASTRRVSARRALAQHTAMLDAVRAKDAAAAAAAARVRLDALR